MRGHVLLWVWDVGGGWGWDVLPPPPPPARATPLSEQQRVLFPQLLEPMPTSLLISNTPLAEHRQVLFPSNVGTLLQVSQGGGGGGRDVLEGKGRLDRRLEEVAEAVGGGYCRLQMPLKLALGVRGTVTGHRLGALDGGGGGGTSPSPPSNASLGGRGDVVCWCRVACAAVWQRAMACVCLWGGYCR